MRKSHGGHRQFAIPRHIIEAFVQRIPLEDRDKAREVWLSRYDLTYAEIHDQLMDQYLDQIRPVLNDKETKAAEQTYFGILETFDFNGYSGFTPRGDNVVVLHQGLGTTLNFWAHWFSRCTVEQNGFDYLTQSPDALERALEFILRSWFGRLTSDNQLPDVTPTTADGWQLSECLTIAAVTFVIGHELGHIINDHDSYNPDKASNHAMEYEADLTGLSICIRHALLKSVHMPDNYYAKFMLFAPLFLLAVMSLLGDDDSETHPSPTSRKNHLLKQYEPELRSFLGQDYDEVVDDIDSDLLSILRRNAEGLFLHFEDYRDLMNSIDIGPRSIDTTWLRGALNHLRT